MRSAVRALALAGAAILASAGSARAEVTYTKDILPVLQGHCQECHRPGEAVPMTFLSYEDVRPWAKSIKKVVETKTMPPWHADPAIGHWKNDRRMSDEEIQKVVSWVDAGAPEGNATDAPAPLKFVEGWKIGTPDIILEAKEETELPSDLVDDYIYVTIPTDFTEDRWLKAIECRPGNVDVVHHIIAFAKPAKGFPPAEKFGEDGISKEGRGGLAGSGLVAIGGMAPGTEPMVCKPGDGIRLPAHYDIIFQMHYHKENGMAAKDRSKIGMIFADYPIQRQKHGDAVSNFMFLIPPNNANYEVKASLNVDKDIELESIMPHMHLRGKSMRVWAELPGGEKRDLLWVPNYDFNWQTRYQPLEPLTIPAGSKLFATATYDNSAGNPANPDPNVAVRFGEPTTAEMMFAFLGYTIPGENLGARDPGNKQVSDAAPVQ